MTYTLVQRTIDIIGQMAERYETRDPVFEALMTMLGRKIRNRLTGGKKPYLPRAPLPKQTPTGWCRCGACEPLQFIK